MFRLSTRADPTFLAEMLYEAVYWRDDGAEERPPLDEMLARPELRRYVEDWGRVGDVALVALDRLDEPVGAAWFRRFADRPGDRAETADGAGTLELVIAVYPECRGQRMGGLLLGSLTSRARADGYPTISLRLASGNPARRLFGRHGFVAEEPPVDRPADSERDGDAPVTMVLDLE